MPDQTVTVRNLALVRGTFTRSEIARLVTGYGLRHPRIWRYGGVHVVFKEAHFAEDGVEVGGEQHKNKLIICTRSRKNRRLRKHEIALALFHELGHLNYRRRGRHTASCKILSYYGRFSGPQLREEMAVILESHDELRQWSDQECRAVELLELKEIAPHAKAKDWGV